MMNNNVVPLRVAKFLRKNFDFCENTLYVYNNSLEELCYSIEPGLYNQIPAPTINDAVEFLWIMGLKIYYVPIQESDYCRGVVEVGTKKYILRNLFDTPQEALLGCLNYISEL